MHDLEHITKQAVHLLIDAGADAEEAYNYISELSSAVPEFPCRFCHGILRWTTDGTINVENEDELQRLNLFLKFMKNSEAGDFYDDDFNGLSFETLTDLFHLNLGSPDYRTPVSAKYTSVSIPSFEALQEYKKWTEDWCITVSEIAFEGYSLEGTNRIILLLRDDYMSVPKKPQAGFPNDSYGNSILCVILRPDGTIDSVTNRWNAIGIETDHPEEFLTSTCEELVKNLMNNQEQ